jgi:hypothetical protein
VYSCLDLVLFEIDSKRPVFYWRQEYNKCSFNSERALLVAFADLTKINIVNPKFLEVFLGLNCQSYLSVNRS